MQTEPKERNFIRLSILTLASVAAIALAGCGSESTAADATTGASTGEAAALKAQTATTLVAAATAKAISLPITQGLYAETSQGCARATHVFFYDGTNYGEIHQAEQAQEVPPHLRGFEGASSAASSDVYRIARVAVPAPGSDDYDENLQGFTRVWNTENPDDNVELLFGVKATGPGRFIRGEGGYGTSGRYFGGERHYQQCTFPQLSAKMQATIRAERPQLAGGAAIATSSTRRAAGLPPIETGYYARGVSCAQAIRDEPGFLNYFDGESMLSFDGGPLIEGFDHLGGNRYRVKGLYHDENGDPDRNNFVIITSGRTSYTDEESGARYTHCPTNQIPRAIRQDWGDLAKN